MGGMAASWIATDPPFQLLTTAGFRSASGAKSHAVLLTLLVMTWLTFASTTAPGGASVLLPALAGAGLLFSLFFLTQLFASKT